MKKITKHTKTIKNQTDMKKFNKLILSLFAVLFAFSACDNIPTPDYWAEPRPEPPAVNLLFFEDFGTTAVQTGTNWPTVAEYTGFRTSGAGADAVRYSAEGTVTVRSNAVSNFPNASGGSNAMMAGTGASFLINDIATCGARNLILSFGSNQTSDVLAVAYRVSGSDEWNFINYLKETDIWGLVNNLEIALPEGTNTIHLRFTAGRTDFGTRIDDIKIVTEEELGEPIIDPDEVEPPVKPTAIFLETFGNSGATDNPRPSIHNTMIGIINIR